MHSSVRSVRVNVKANKNLSYLCPRAPSTSAYDRDVRRPRGVFRRPRSIVRNRGGESIRRVVTDGDGDETVRRRTHVGRDVRRALAGVESRPRHGDPFQFYYTHVADRPAYSLVVAVVLGDRVRDTCSGPADFVVDTSWNRSIYTGPNVSAAAVAFYTRFTSSACICTNETRRYDRVRAHGSPRLVRFSTKPAVGCRRDVCVYESGFLFRPRI